MKNVGSDETPSNRFAFDSFDAESLSFKFDNLQQLQHVNYYVLMRTEIEQTERKEEEYNKNGEDRKKISKGRGE